MRIFVGAKKTSGASLEPAVEEASRRDPLNVPTELRMFSNLLQRRNCKATCYPASASLKAAAGWESGPRSICVPNGSLAYPGSKNEKPQVGYAIALPLGSM